MYGVFGTCSRSRYTAPKYFLWFLILLVGYIWQSGCVLSSSADKAALLSIKTSIQADPLGLLSDWEVGVDSCTWRGVGCDATGRVVSLNITGSTADTLTSSCSPFSLSCKASPGTALSFQASEKTAYLSRCRIQAPSFPTDTTPCMLRGSLSPAIGNLSQLRFLFLPFNGFFGEVPKEISALRFLELLDLQGNKFSGSLPTGLGQLSELKTLNVAYNFLQGTIPQEISGCRKLKVLNVAGNRLSGGIPTFFDSMPDLQVVALGNNMLSGTIPLELTSNCSNLEHVHLEGNDLVGVIPTGFGRCSRMQSLVLASNSLSGQIPADIGQLQELQVFDVSRNSLGDDIPAQLANCSQLSILVLTNSNDPPPCHGQELPSMAVSEDVTSSNQKGEFNYFSSIPTALMALPNLRILWAPGAALGGILSSKWGSSLEVLNLASNSLTGSAPEGLAQCKRLIYLDLSNNKLEGSLPSTLSVHCMVVFNVSGNSLQGQLPDRFSSSCSTAVLLESLFSSVPGSFLSDNASFAVGTLSSYFSSLYCGGVFSRLPGWFSNQSMAVVHDMSDNNFTGPLRSVELGKVLLEKAPVYGFFVSGNQLTGTLSSSLFESCQNYGTFSLKVSRNKFSGALPADAMSKCISLKQFEAAANQLVRIVPNGLGRLKHLVYLDLSSNSLSGTLPSDVGQLQELQYFMVADNNLTGTIPESFGKLASLVVLDLSGNRLTGSIPGDLANLSNLKKLLLSNNHLSGFIPTNFTRLRYLSVMDVAYNNLSGSVPHAGSLASWCSNVSTEGNQLLKSCSLSTPAPASSEPLPYAGPVPKKSHHPNSILISAITSGCAIVAVLIILILLFHYTKHERRVHVSHRSERKHVSMFRNFDISLTYENVVAATGNFSVNNLIGTGGFGATYKAELMPGVLVAVKRLSLGRFQGTQQFEAEIRTLGRVQHPNLVTLFGYHASETEMFLIYNYLPGGNLENLIHDSRRGFVSWRVRVKIALNIAQALAYLHDECTPRVLHRDIKPSNVLLDNNLNAFLSDFGLARLLSASETHATTDVAGTFGYVAPEYAMTCRLSEKADVYSYGVVLLELLSGKKALDPYFSKYGNGFNIVAWACHFYKKGKPSEILAPGLWEQGPHSELMNVLKLAVRCTMASLSVRPTMRQVVDTLRAVR
eukprot:c5359_g1_i1 orf=893-4372(-)